MMTTFLASGMMTNEKLMFIILIKMMDDHDHSADTSLGLVAISHNSDRVCLSAHCLLFSFSITMPLGLFLFV